MKINTSASKNNFILTAVLVFCLAMGLLYFLNKYQTQQINLDNNTEKEAAKDRYFVSQDFKFSFRLSENRQALPCESNSESSNRILVSEVSAAITVDPESACAGEGFSESITADSKDALGIYKMTPQEYITKYLEEDYNLTTEEYTLSGVPGIRVKGTIKPGVLTPLPASIDQVIISKNNTLYTITSSFYERDFKFSV